MQARSQVTETGAARLFATGAGLLGVAVLADSALEHYRGSYRNPAMLLPLAASTAAIGSSVRTVARPATMAGRAGTDLSSIGVGSAGIAFHIWNLAKGGGRSGFGRFFYRAPIGAPAALILSGLLGNAAHRLAGKGPRSRSAGRVVAAVTAVGVAGTTAEAALLHFRGAYHNPAMWLPVTLPPVAALSVARDVSRNRKARATIPLLGLTALLGLAGSAFHAWGVSRNMGGWSNWRQNILAGPPIPAPPAFTGLAIAAIGALRLMGARHG